ncbi:MAG: Lrp/AsnC family transcriptional regulator [Clostridia bacterium]|nr:Lrp/AsnC family transcriptional regulator [Clostridia bacterium]MBR2442545.1 Lrp/AsnC family transcriptional regulator [Clostridia bacterium]
MEKLHEEVLALLRQDARITAPMMAKMLGATESEVASAIADMEKSGVIVKYTAIVNDDAINKDGVEALIEVKVSPVREKGFDEIAQYIYQFDEVKSVYLMSGAYDLAVFVEGRSLRDAARFVSEKLSAIDKVLSTATHFILKKYKLEGIVLEKNKEKRLVYQP